MPKIARIFIRVARFITRSTAPGVQKTELQSTSKKRKNPKVGKNEISRPGKWKEAWCLPHNEENKFQTCDEKDYKDRKPGCNC